MGNISERKWLGFGICWLILLGVFTAVAKVVERPKSPGGASRLGAPDRGIVTKIFEKLPSPSLGPKVSPGADPRALPVPQTRVSRVPETWVSVKPPFDVPNISFRTDSPDAVLDYEKLQEFAKNLLDHAVFTVIIEGRAASGGVRDRQLAAARADFVRNKLSQLGLETNRIISNSLPSSVPGVRGVTFRVGEWHKISTNK